MVLVLNPMTLLILMIWKELFVINFSSSYLLLWSPYLYLWTSPMHRILVYNTHRYWSIYVGLYRRVLAFEILVKILWSTYRILVRVCELRNCIKCVLNWNCCRSNYIWTICLLCVFKHYIFERVYRESRRWSSIIICRAHFDNFRSLLPFYVLMMFKVCFVKGY